MKKLIPLLVAVFLPALAFAQTGVKPTIHSSTPRSTKFAHSGNVPAQLDATFGVWCPDCAATTICRKETLNVDGAFAVNINDARKCSETRHSVTGLGNLLAATSKGNGFRAPNLNLSNSNVNNQIAVTAFPYNATGNYKSDDFLAIETAYAAAAGILYP